jgi:ABC-type antimicrobial peptide transport system permease subunit
LSLVVRTHGEAATYVAAIKKAIWSVDNEQSIVRIALMDDLLAASAAERRFVLLLFEAFGLVALTLAATGLYGVLSGSVTERTREIGVRSALGATRQSIVALILRQGMTLTGLGLVLGLVGAVAASQAIASMLFGVSRLDPFTYVGVMLLLAIVSAIACAMPAWRAARIDPSIALRCE